MSSQNFKIITHIIPGQHIRHYAAATKHSEEAVQYLEAKYYQPICNSSPKAGDATILLAGAASFPKELYEPLWDSLLLLPSTIFTRGQEETSLEEPST